MTLKELQRAERDASQAHSKLKFAKEQYYNREYDARVQPLIHEIETETGEKFDKLIEDAFEVWLQARDAADKATVEAVTADTGWFPAGTKVKYVPDRRFSFRVDKMDGQLGVIEVWTKESRYPDNMRWGMPHPGDIVIRFLKKDGSPSLKFVRKGGLYGGDEKLWHEVKA